MQFFECLDMMKILLHFIINGNLFKIKKLQINRGILIATFCDPSIHLKSTIM